MNLSACLLALSALVVLTGAAFALDRPDDPRLVAMMSDGSASIERVRVPDRPVEVYERVELKVEADGTWTNPFDPDDVRLYAFVTTPEGDELIVPGFYFVGYQRMLIDGEEVLEPTGESGWRVRYTPMTVGEHTIRVVLDDGSARVESEPVRVEAVESDRPGFVRISDTNPLYFEHDDGSLFFASGLNFGWPGEGGTYEYDRILIDTAKHRGNTVRVWLAPTFHKLSLESSENFDDWGLAGGLGWMNQDAAWRFDHVVWTAERLGIKVMPVAFSFSGWRGSAWPKNWHESPYNSVNGGPLDDPSEVFTDPRVRELAKRRLRYIVARWGASPSVLAWELWNEVSGVDGYDREDSAAWHREMATYVKSIDAFGHPVSTSTWWTEGAPLLDSMDALDFNMTHEYNAPDHGIVHYAAAIQKIEEHDELHLTGEFGNQEFDYGDSGVYEPERISVHNVLWASLMGGSAGGGLYWYWEIGEKDAWARLFEPLAEFVDDLPLNEARFEPFMPRVARRTEAPTPTRDGPVFVYGAARSWNPAPWNRPNTVRFDEHGNPVRPWDAPSVLHPEGGRLSNPVTFELGYTRTGTFAVHVKTVSGWGGAGLTIEIDGQTLLRKEFTDPDPDSLDEIERYNGEYRVDVPEGARTIRVSNHGRDWMWVHYEFDGVRDGGSVPLWVTALEREDAGPGEVMFAVCCRHVDFNWGGARAGVEVPVVPSARIELGDAPRGAYEVEWVSTLDGRVLEESAVEHAGGTLVVRSSAIDRSAAGKVRRVREAGR